MAGEGFCSGDAEAPAAADEEVGGLLPALARQVKHRRYELAGWEF